MRNLDGQADEERRAPEAAHVLNIATRSRGVVHAARTVVDADVLAWPVDQVAGHGIRLADAHAKAGLMVGSAGRLMPNPENTYWVKPSHEKLVSGLFPVP